MKQITEPISIKTTSEQEHRNVFARLASMGFNHSSWTFDKIMNSWIRNPVFAISAENLRGKIYVRFGEVPHGYHCVSTSQFLAEYGPAEVAAPETPLNPPNFTVDTHHNKTLSRIVQELAFAAELTWSDSRTLQNGDFRYIHITRSAYGDIFDRVGLMLDTTSIADCAKDNPVYDAATQMGEIVRLLSTPVVPPAPPPPTPPEIHGYKAVYTAGRASIQFGCADIWLHMLRSANGLMRPDWSGNRQVDSITLSSGKTLSREQVTEILGYVAAVEEYAKKYPQKS